MNFHNMPKSPITGVPGWITESEESQLIELAKSVDGLIVQSGSEWGRITAALLESGNPVYVRAFGSPDIHADNLSANGRQCVYLDNSSIPVDIAMLVMTFTDKHQLESEFRKYRGSVLPGGLIVIRNYATNTKSHPLHYEIKEMVDSWPASRFGTITIIGGDDLMVITFYDDDTKTIQAARENASDMMPLEDFIDESTQLAAYDKLPDEFHSSFHSTPLRESLGDDVPPNDFDALSTEDLIDIGKINGLKMGRYKRRESVIDKLRSEGLL